MEPEPTIPHSRPSLNSQEMHAVLNVLACGQLAQGPRVEDFEAALGAFHGLPPGVATSSGTTALHLALLSLGVGRGDEVFLPSYVCSAPLHAVYHSGATPVLVDVDPATGNVDLNDLKKRLTPKSKVIIAVHHFGLPAEMDELVSFGLPVIEDCAQALGAEIGGKKVGTLGAVAICSFYATKIITTGEGGMVLSHDTTILQKIRNLRDYDERNSFGVRFNYKMTDIQAAIGRSQLRKLEKFLQERDKLAHVYSKNLVSLPCTLPPSSQGRIYYRYIISVEQNVSNLIQRLARENIQAARPVYRPLHRYLNLEGYSGAELAWNSQLSLPIYPSLAAEEVQQICRALRRLFENDSR